MVSLPRNHQLHQKGLAIKVYHRLNSGEISRFQKVILTVPYRHGFVQGVLMYADRISTAVFKHRSIVFLLAGPKGREAVRKSSCLSLCGSYMTPPLDYLHDSLSTQKKDESFT